MSEAILTVLQWISDLSVKLTGNSAALTGTFGSYLNRVYEYANTVMQSVCMPVAYVVLALFFVMELYKASTRIDGSGGGTPLGVEMVFRVMFKMVICKMVVDKVPLLMKAIFDVTAELSQSIRDLNSGEGISKGMELAEAEKVVSDIGFIPGIPVLLLCFIVFLITLFAVAFANVIIITRFIELYIYLAVSPIPIATIPNEELSQIGKNFFKSFAAVCIQGTLIYLVLTFYPMIFNQAFQDTTTAENTNIYMILLGTLSYSIVLILAVFSTGKWAKSICGAM